MYGISSYLTSQETKAEGHVNIIGYRIIPDENINPGKYGFKLLPESGVPHLFSSHDKMAIRGWITALLKLKIDYCAEGAYLLVTGSYIMALYARTQSPQRPQLIFLLSPWRLPRLWIRRHALHHQLLSGRHCEP